MPLRSRWRSCSTCSAPPRGSRPGGSTSRAREADSRELVDAAVARLDGRAVADGDGATVLLDLAWAEKSLAALAECGGGTARSTRSRSQLTVGGGNSPLADGVARSPGRRPEGLRRRSRHPGARRDGNGDPARRRTPCRTPAAGVNSTQQGAFPARVLIGWRWGWSHTCPVTVLLVIGVGVVALGAFVLLLFPDRPGGKIAWQGPKSVDRCRTAVDRGGDRRNRDLG